jgi:hypothetical protein
MKRVAAFAVALSIAGAAQAQDAPICSDRPAKANAVCTVPAGRIQLETSITGWALTETGAGRTELLTFASTAAKLGLSDSSDVQIAFTPVAELTSRNAGASQRASGFGDILVRYKHRLTASGAPVQLALIPFVKLPTASRGLGNGRAEGGLAVPISFAPGGPAAITLGPELDLLADADGSGRHIALVNVVNVSAAVAPRWTVAGELWTNLNLDPAGTIRQASADAAVAYALSRDLQLDAGVNLGLTDATPDVEIYLGMSLRF